jgi:DNA-binding NtrC family response regulator
VVGTSLVMRRVTRELRRVAAVRGPVLLRGETGTGKDVLARALHVAGPRRARAFVPMNVGTLPRELAEAELFGHERGAYTGAHASREGAFVEANGGTLFLDEIGELPHDVQVKLLRVLEDGMVRPVGGKPRKVDVRIVSATWAPLERRVGEGTFRHDLWQRLAVFVIDVPPLRERRTDIVALAEKTLADVREEVGARALTPAAIARLAAHTWPGNVRELRNVVYRAALRTPTRTIRAEDIAESLYVAAPARSVLSAEQAQALLESHQGNVSAAARQLGVPRSTFRGWLGPGR